MNNNSNNLCLNCMRLGSCQTAKKKNIYEENCPRWLPVSKAVEDANAKLINILGKEFAQRIMTKTPIKEKLKMTTESNWPTPEEVAKMTYKEKRNYAMQNEEGLGIEHYHVFAANNKEKITKLLNDAIAAKSGTAKPKRQAAKPTVEKPAAAAKPKRQAAKPKAGAKPDSPVAENAALDAITARLNDIETRIAANAEATGESIDNLRAEVSQLKDILSDTLRCALAASGLPGDTDEILNIVKEMHPLG